MCRGDGTLGCPATPHATHTTMPNSHGAAPGSSSFLPPRRPLPRAAADLPPLGAFLDAALPLAALLPALPAGCLPSLPPLRPRPPDLAGAASAGSLRLPLAPLPLLPFLAAGRGLGEALRLAPDALAGADLAPALAPDAAPPFFFPEAGSGAGVAEAVRPDRRGAALGAAASSSCAGSCRPERRLSPAILLLRRWLRRPWRPAARAAGGSEKVGEAPGACNRHQGCLHSNDGAGDFCRRPAALAVTDHASQCGSSAMPAGTAAAWAAGHSSTSLARRGAASPCAPQKSDKSHLYKLFRPPAARTAAGSSRGWPSAPLLGQVCRPILCSTRFTGRRSDEPIVCAPGWLPAAPHAAPAAAHALVPPVAFRSRSATAVPSSHHA